VKGAFTGAVADRRGKFELADGGTLFLDEIGDMSLKTQAKVLRALQEQVVEPSAARPACAWTCGCSRRRTRTCRRDPPGRFREDLYFRLNVIPIFVPAAARSRDDIPRLAEHFMSGARARVRAAGRSGFDPSALPGAACSYRWPGNVRELRNVIERLMIMVPGDTVTLADLSFLEGAAAARGLAPER
jgi:two-component system, NtrC family, nitrogen regulation response regulator NtrX